MVLKGNLGLAKSTLQCLHGKEGTNRWPRKDPGATALTTSSRNPPGCLAVSPFEVPSFLLYHTVLLDLTPLLLTLASLAQLSPTQQ